MLKNSDRLSVLIRKNGSKLFIKLAIIATLINIAKVREYLPATMHLSSNYEVNAAIHNTVSGPECALRIHETDKGDLDFLSVHYVKGGVTIDSTEMKQLVVKQGDPISIDARINTDNDGFVSLSTSGLDTINIQPASHLWLKDLLCSKTKYSRSFSVSTPHLSAAVRG